VDEEADAVVGQEGAVLGNGDMGGNNMAEAVKSATKAAVQRIIREVRPANDTIAKPLANALANNGSKILQAIAPAKHLNQTLLETGRQIVDKAANSSVVLKL
jgi:ribosomal protein S5